MNSGMRNIFSRKSLSLLDVKSIKLKIAFYLHRNRKLRGERIEKVK